MNFYDYKKNELLDKNVVDGCLAKTIKCTDGVTRLRH